MRLLKQFWFGWVFFLCFGHISLAQEKDSLAGKSIQERILVMREMAVASMYKSPTDALKFGKQALFLAEEGELAMETARCYELIARLCANQVNYLQATEYYIRALTYYEKVNNRNAIGFTCNLIGRVYTDLKQYHIASRYFFKALDIGKKSENQTLIADSYRNLAYHFAMQEYYESALQYNDKALKIYESTKNMRGMGSICNTFGEIYKNTERPKQALPFLNKAFEIYSQFGEEWEIVTTLSLTGEAYFMMGNFERAEIYYDRTHKKAFKMNHQRALLTNIRNFARLYRAMGLHRRANRYYENYNEIYESVYNSHSLQQTSFLQTLYEIDKKEAEIKLLNQKGELQTRINYILAASSIIFLMFVFFLWKSIRSKNRAYNLLEKQTRETQRQKEIAQQRAVESKRVAEELTAVNQQLKETQYSLEKALAQEQKSKAQLRKTYEELKNAQAQLVQSEKMASLGQLTAGIAHEINNPINFIYAGSEAMRDVLEGLFEDLEPLLGQEGADELIDKDEVEEYKEDVFELLESLRTGAKRTADIVKGLRTFSRLDEDALKDVDLHENIDSTLSILRNQFKEKVEIVKDYSPDIQKVECYPGPLNQVFMNILANAIQAIDETGHVFIMTRKSGGMVRIHIKDTGKGMSQETKQRIFEPFYTTKDVGEGTGLGLSISHGIIEKHGGTIDVVSALNEGAEFIISLPERR